MVSTDESVLSLHLSMHSDRFAFSEGVNSFIFKECRIFAFGCNGIGEKIRGLHPFSCVAL